MRQVIAASIALIAAVAVARAEGPQPGKPWQRPGSTVVRAALCDGVDDSGQPRHPGQKFDQRQRVIVLWLKVDPAGHETTYDVVWSRGNKTILQRSLTTRWGALRLLTLAPRSSAYHVPGLYQVEVREDGLPVWRIPFVIEEKQ